MFACVAVNLARARAKRGLTQLQAAVAVGVDPQMIARWERGDTQINAAHLKLLADLYEFPLDAFYEENHRFLPPVLVDEESPKRTVPKSPAPAVRGPRDGGPGKPGRVVSRQSRPRTH